MKTSTLVLPALLILGVSSASFGVYGPPPDWMPMTMLGVGYDSSSKSLSVVPESNYSYGAGKPYPSLSGAPGAKDSITGLYDPSFLSYDPSKAWAVLNGTAFSRRLGWYDDVNGDFYATARDALLDNPLPADRFVWIEKTGGSPQLRTYAVEEALNPTGPYDPIFGTDGSSTKWKWDGFMDHNSNAVALADITSANQTFSATYHLYIGDGAGVEDTAYTGTTTVWTWEWYGDAPSIVPEPASLSLLTLAGASLFLRAKKR